MITMFVSAKEDGKQAIWEWMLFMVSGAILGVFLLVLILFIKVSSHLEEAEFPEWLKWLEKKI